jgi:DNA polymerase III alpha subunit
VGKTVWLIRDRTGYGNLCRLIAARKLGRGHSDTTGLYRVDDVTDVVFATKQEWRVHRLLSAIRENTLVAHVENVASPEAYLRDDVGVTADDERLAGSCDWNFLPAPKVFPRDQGGMERLRALCTAALPWRYPERPPRERIEYELGIIGKLGYADYFVVVHDIVRYSRERGLPVAGRGSGASSVVAYLLGITNVCPIAFDLPFERFLHEGRTDYPDIDVDFSCATTSSATSSSASATSRWCRRTSRSSTARRSARRRRRSATRTTR